MEHDRETTTFAEGQGLAERDTLKKGIVVGYQDPPTKAPPPARRVREDLPPPSTASAYTPPSPS